MALAVAGCGRAPTPSPSSAQAERPPEVALPAVRFVDVTEEAGIDFVHVNGAEGDKLLPETMGAGAAFLDYDGDGDPDLFLVNSASWPGRGTATESSAAHRLYRNDGAGRFEDVTREAGLDKVFYGQGVAVGDYDNDGRLDLYITSVGRGYLFRNVDGTRFEDVSDQANARGPAGWLTSAAFLDVDNDGDLDLFLCNYVEWSAEIDKAQGFELAGLGRAYGPPSAFTGALCALLRNDGGRFTDISAESGVQVFTPDLKRPLGKSLGVAPRDIDGDGLVDIAVANDTVQNFLFHNKGGGRFEEIALLSGIAFDQSGSPRGGMGCDWGDVTEDGRWALAIGNFANEMTALYVQDGPGEIQFTDLANRYGLGAASQPPLKFGLFFFDYDLDGRLDLLTVNGHLEPDVAKALPGESHAQPAQLFWNSGQVGPNLYKKVGAEVTGPDLFEPMVGRGSAYADIDGDGDLDVIVTANNGPARLFRNDGGNANRWVRLILEGDGRKSNRSAIGAKVAVRVGDRVLRRQLFPARGYLSSVELPITLGLEKAETIDELTIAWPSGGTTRLKNLKADRTHRIDEAAGLR